MGLDLVEFAMAVEDEFGITIDDTAAIDITTCRQLADYVISRLDDIDDSDPRCLSQMQFNHLRRVLVNEFGAQRKNVQLNTPTQTLLGHDIKQEWGKLKEAVGSKYFPDLHCKWYFHFCALLTVFVMTYALIHIKTPYWLTIPLTLFLLGSLYIRILPKFADQPPPSNTIRELVPFVSLKKFPFEWKNHPEHILQHIQFIAANSFGIDIEKIDPDAHFVHDLGVD